MNVRNLAIWGVILIAVALIYSVMQGQATFEELLAAQETYDNYFLDSPEWRAART